MVVYVVVRHTVSGKNVCLTMATGCVVIIAVGLIESKLVYILVTLSYSIHTICSSIVGQHKHCYMNKHAACDKQ